MRALTGQEIVIASHNVGKISETRALLEPFGFRVQSAADFGLTEPDETEDTFAGNARIKAHFTAQNTGLPALSDDSGIEVDALDGAPGVFTADWAETPNGRDFVLAMKKVWNLLEEKNARAPHTARFRCTLCLAWADGHDEIFEGKVEGRVIWPMRGTLGFGFDPMFLPTGETMTFGEMDPVRKHAISHRADAFSKLVSACLTP